MNAHGVEVLDGAHDDAVAGNVAHDLHLDLLPALDGLLYEHLVLRRERKSLRDDALELPLVAGDAAACATQRERRAYDHGKSHLRDDATGILHAVGATGACHLEAEVRHRRRKELAVLAPPDRVKVAADDLDAELVEYARLAQGDGAVERRLSAHVGQQGVGPFALDDATHRVEGDGLDVGPVRGVRVGHDRRGVRVHEHDREACGAQGAAGLGARVVELAGLADDDGSRADDQDLLDVLAPRHQKRLPSCTSMAR